MPTITDIARQKGRDNRFSIKVDGVYAFALSDLDMSASQLRVGGVLSVAELEQWQRAAGESKAYDQALRYLGIRRRSRAEIAKYLVRKGWGEDEVSGVLARLEKLGLIDDPAFAAAWIRERRLLRPRSIQALKFELAKLGISRSDIEEALQAEPGDEVGMLMELISRRRRQYPSEDKLIAYLARQGYRYDQIKQALSRLSDLSEP
jgi:regulatory protein